MRTYFDSASLLSAFSQFREAINNKDLNAFNTLLRQYKDMSIWNIKEPPVGATLLHFAADIGYDYAVQCLLEKGANVDAKTVQNATALHIASIKGYVTIVKLLIQHKADINSKTVEGWTPLYSASQNGHENVVRFLLESGANPNIKSLNDSTPLHAASEKGHITIVKLLIQHKAEINSKTVESWTPLYPASQNGYENVVRLLLENGANPNIQISDGRTPLHAAIDNRHNNIVRQLLNKGAECRAADSQNVTPLHRACQTGDVSIVRLLIQHGADIDAKANINTLKDITPLYVASQNGYENVVKLLLETGANPNIKTSQGGTPLAIALYKQHNNIVQILIDHDKNINKLHSIDTSLPHAALPLSSDVNTSLLNTTSTVAMLPNIINTSLLNTTSTVAMLPNITSVNQTSNISTLAQLAHPNISLTNSTFASPSLITSNTIEENIYALQLYKAEEASATAWTNIVLDVKQAGISATNCGMCLLLRDILLQQGYSPHYANLGSFIAMLSLNAGFAAHAYIKGANVLLSGLPMALSMAISLSLFKTNWLTSAITTTVGGAALSAGINSWMGASAMQALGQAIGQAGLSFVLTSFVSKSEKWIADRYLTTPLALRLKKLGNLRKKLLRELPPPKIQTPLRDYLALGSHFHARYDALIKSTTPTTNDYVKVYELEQELRNFLAEGNIGPSRSWEQIEREKKAELQQLQAQLAVYQKAEAEKKAAKIAKKEARGNWFDPITNELFKDPIKMQCCNRNFERAGLKEWLSCKNSKKEFNISCPLCRKNIPTFAAIEQNLPDYIRAELVDDAINKIPRDEKILEEILKYQRMDKYNPILND